ncbi:MAG: DUF1330 domain-containing protein [Rhodospirillales bacterium]|jgi:uncharacterized protein (DUF1330 family)|nr:DUF1330 domain-containing protein [Rhodospirillales bacterium]MDP6883115.1 DUF1330 domain-containing protein [Rhodospirillales bacterium]
MSAYVIAMLDVSDQENYEKYAAAAPAATAKYGGKAIARGPTAATLEGDFSPQRIVILEFPTVEDAKAWYASPEYQEARNFRLGAADFRMLVADGI